MKTHPYIFIFSIGSLAVLGWWDHGKLTALRETRDRLSARAVKFGIPLENPSISKRLRPDRASEAKLAAARFIKHHKAHEAVKLAGEDPEKSPEIAANACFDWMAVLDSKQVRMVIEEVLNDPELDDKSRRKLIGNVVWLLVNDDPAGALALFSEFSTHLRDTGLGRQIAQSSLGALARESPHAALTWARDHAAGFPEIIKSTQETLISNTAIQDPALAFEIIRESGPHRNPGDLEAFILSSSKPEMRTMAFAALRQHLVMIDDQNVREEVEQRAWAGLAPGIAQDGFESGSKWLISVNLTAGELSNVLQRMGIGLANARKMEDTGRWVEWAAGILPAVDGEKCVLDMVKGWTSNDFHSAGLWLNACPESPMKLTAVRAYAETLARTEPEAAAQWALTLPPGKVRDQTLNNIYQNWPKEDATAKEAFATEHGVK